jgi:hypothetical protein
MRATGQNEIIGVILHLFSAYINFYVHVVGGQLLLRGSCIIQPHVSNAIPNMNGNHTPEDRTRFTKHKLPKENKEGHRRIYSSHKRLG